MYMHTCTYVHLYTYVCSHIRVYVDTNTHPIGSVALENPD